MCVTLYCICIPECDAFVGVFEEIGNFSCSWAIVGKVVHFLFLLSPLSGIWWIFHCSFTFRFVMILSGKLLLFALYFIVIHSACCLSVVNDSDCNLVTWYWYAAISCSVGWLDRKLMVVLVVVGFQYISIFKLSGFLIIRRSKQFMLPLFSCVGLSCRFVFGLCIHG
jgi:hypothetical protein